jgi:hypothetical protein
MPRFQNWSELGTAAVGRLGAGALSPESWIGFGTLKAGVRGGTTLRNAGEAALKNGILVGATDPVVQGLNIQAGVQDEYDPLRTFVATGLGALFGGGAQLGTEALGKLAAHWLPQLGFSTGGNPVRVTVYRVEGAPNTRILISETGDVIVQGRQALFLNFGSIERAEEYLAMKIQKGLPDAVIKSFEVPQGFLDALRSAGVTEAVANKSGNRGRPIVVDVTKAPDQYSLRRQWIDRLIESIIPGSGKIEQ